MARQASLAVGAVLHHRRGWHTLFGIGLSLPGLEPLHALGHGIRLDPVSYLDCPAYGPGDVQSDDDGARDGVCAARGGAADGAVVGSAAAPAAVAAGREKG